MQEELHGQVSAWSPSMHSLAASDRKSLSREEDACKAKTTKPHVYLSRVARQGEMEACVPSGEMQHALLPNTLHVHTFTHFEARLACNHWQS